ncbi:winged helix-turn-helix transcriptional regulator, partial [Candidatus Woesearchaeota archaeon]|nr:winged helix-turn-helix transcriptional regulator [Candidatus Woesearchaeota archaeon]
FIFILTFSMLYVSDAIKDNNACGCVIPIPYMLLLLSSLGLFVGSLSFYILISKHLKESRKMGRNAELTLNFLDDDERMIIRELIRNKGVMPQSELDEHTGMHRVKVHRVLNRLEDKGIITKIDLGKANRIRLAEGLVEIFCETL